MTETIIPRGVKLSRTLKFILPGTLCNRCHKRRILDDWHICHSCAVEVCNGQVAIRWCRTCHNLPAVHGCDFCDSCLRKRVADMAIADANSRLNYLLLKRRDHYPKVKPPPAIYNSPTCWNCKREKLHRIPPQSLVCYDCHTHRCQDGAGCSNYAMYRNGYEIYCAQHFNERAYCRWCGKRKEFSGMEYCSDCSATFERRRVRWINKYWIWADLGCRCGRGVRYGPYKQCRKCQGERLKYTGKIHVSTLPYDSPVRTNGF